MEHTASLGTTHIRETKRAVRRLGVGGATSIVGRPQKTMVRPTACTEAFIELSREPTGFGSRLEKLVDAAYYLVVVYQLATISRSNALLKAFDLASAATRREFIKLRSGGGREMHFHARKCRTRMRRPQLY